MRSSDQLTPSKFERDLLYNEACYIQGRISYETARARAEELINDEKIRLDGEVDRLEYQLARYKKAVAFLEDNREFVLGELGKEP